MSVRRLAKAVIAAGAATAAVPATADIAQVEAEGSVADVMRRLEAAVVTAGANVFAKVDHGAGAESVGMPVGASQLLIFGNPALGTPAIAADPLAGLDLPLKVLVYEDEEGRTWIAYREIEEMFEDLSIDEDAEFVADMEQVLGRFVETAASE